MKFMGQRAIYKLGRRHVERIKTYFMLDTISKYKTSLIKHVDRMQRNMHIYQRSINQMGGGILEGAAD
jgi:hypothetical protein